MAERARIIAVASWVAPLVSAAMFALAVIYGMPGFSPDWVVVAPLVLCAIFVPLGLGLGIAVLLLVPRPENSSARKHAVAGLVLDCILIVILLVLFLMGETVQPFIYAI